MRHRIAIGPGDVRAAAAVLFATLSLATGTAAAATAVPPTKEADVHSVQSPGPGALRDRAGVPDLHALQVQDLDGKPVSLSQVARGGATLIVFLRHFG